jgi:FimV-like protein
VNKSSANTLRRATRSHPSSRSLISALVAASGGLAALPANALELGDIKVNSTLGQPLRASIAYALAPKEALADTCVSLQGGASAEGLPLVGPASLSVADGVIFVAGHAAVSEPLMSLRLNVRCPYTPHLSREYMLFVDPPQPVSVAADEPSAVTTRSRTELTAASPRTEVATRPQTAASTLPRTEIASNPQAGAASSSRSTAVRQSAAARRAPAPLREPIGNSVRYRVQPGDTLSQIAQRIDNRSIGLWDAVDAIFQANPAAFIANNPNRLKAGSWLDIPNQVIRDTSGSTGNQPAKADDDSLAAVTADDVAAATSEAYEAPAMQAVATAVNVVEQELDAATDNGQAAAAAAEPGDVAATVDEPYVALDDATLIIPDTQLEGPETASSSPNVRTASIQPPATDSSTGNWVWWLVGSGLAIIAGLLLLISRNRGRLGSTPNAALAAPQRRATDANTQTAKSVDDNAVISDDSPTVESLILDANLEFDTELQVGTHVDSAQDFELSMKQPLDLELPFEPAIDEDSADNKITVSRYKKQESILVSEVLPENDDETYEMSVMIDATKLHENGGDTVDRLETVATDDADKPVTDIDLEILEKDYENEMTATQALNEELTLAAAELKASMSDEDNSRITLASLSDLDVTAQLPANDDDDTIEVSETPASKSN